MINQSTGHIEDVASLYAAYAKAEAPASMQRMVKGKPHRMPSASTINVAELLEAVKNKFSDSLSDDVVKQMGVERKTSEITERLRYSARIYEQTDDEILSALDTSSLRTQAERESYFRQFGSLPSRGAWIEPAISCILLPSVVYLRWDGVGVSSSHLVDFAMVCGISDCSLFAAVSGHFFSYLSGHSYPDERVVK